MLRDVRTENVTAAFAVALVDHLADAAGEVGLGPTAAATLTFTASHPGCRIESLRSGLRISHSGAVRDVDRLVERGLLERRPGLGRSTAVHLTRSGAEVATKIQALRLQAAEDVLSPLSEEERGTLVTLLDRILTANTRNRRTADTTCRLCDYDGCDPCPVDWGARTDGGRIQGPRGRIAGGRREEDGNTG
jgi:MarR family transcriptional regulator, negative regulator of the multidrug operon emrRAB